jgi:hypothetical protein
MQDVPRAGHQLRLQVGPGAAVDPAQLDQSAQLVERIAEPALLTGDVETLLVRRRRHQPQHPQRGPHVERTDRTLSLPAGGCRASRLSCGFVHAV